MAAFADEVDNRPMIFAHLEMLSGEFNEFSASQPAP